MGSEGYLKQLNNREEIDFSGFIGNLKTHEMEMKVWEEIEPLKKKFIAFRVFPSILEKEDSKDKNKEEDFAMLIRKVGKMFYNKRRKSNFWRSRQKEKFERKKGEDGSFLSLQEDGPSYRILPLTTNYYLQKSAQEKEGHDGHLGRFRDRTWRRSLHCKRLLHGKWWWSI